jgi:hypothetical protein
MIGASGVAVGRDITVANQGSGATTLGGNITSGTGTFSGNVALNKPVNLNADGTLLRNQQLGPYDRPTR